MSKCIGSGGGPESGTAAMNGNSIAGGSGQVSPTGGGGGEIRNVEG
jgi:hypothetical protein